MQRYVVEFGMGADLHGCDSTKAALRAVHDATHRSCLCGLVEIMNRGGFEGVHVHVDLAVPHPERVDCDAVLAAVPIGEKSIEVKDGGLAVPGIEVPVFATGSSDIVIAVAALTVSVAPKGE
ncbi:MAG: Lin0512 family protein [Desulfovibrio sp.]|nr:Lin0512 family protein [Desulfovibrio sp.]MBQ1420315.1 Lin0512 family protein [Desulfovibrio sp.]MBQ1539645.1 Lin0512 family protein [Desulfovibrio sp.]MBQ1844931.1 Lin0512 family protein [Desulfovibrio sp.]MBQ4125012.1 Lin0512 family protein [Desulfovibrio sp.]